MNSTDICYFPYAEPTPTPILTPRWNLREWDFLDPLTGPKNYNLIRWNLREWDFLDPLTGPKNYNLIRHIPM